MIVVALDTSAREGSIILRADGRQWGPLGFGQADSHLVSIGRGLEELLDQAGKRIEEVDRIALVSGPGSFTGLRIGMAFAKGVHAALGTGLVMLGSLELLALNHAAGGELVCPMIDARKKEIYSAVYRPAGPPAGDDEAEPLDRLQTVLPRQVIGPAALLRQIKSRTGGETILFAGSGAQQYGDDITAALGPAARFAEGGRNRPSVALLAKLAATMEVLPAEQVLTLEPLYIRPSDAQLKPLKAHRSHDPS